MRTLKQRSVTADVTFLYKASNGYLNTDVTKYLKLYLENDRYIVRGCDGIGLKKNGARTKCI